jgi:threonine aldolase
LKSFRVDLRSDTVSTPSHGMRVAMSRAEVGDDVYGEDPTVNRLESVAASMAGFPRAVFMASGTMANGVAVRTIAAPGDEVICGTRSHVYLYEGAQYAMLGGVQMHRMDEDPSGCLPPARLREALSRIPDDHTAPRTLVTLENTQNIMGGLVLPGEDVDAVIAAAAASGASVFLDGARLWHVHTATGTPLDRLTRGFRMVSMCFSKALGCPVGSVLLCSEADEPRVRRMRKCQGGGMRQAGILAAACLYALEHNLPDLPRTHRWAGLIAAAVRRSTVLELEREVQTNIVLARTPKGRAAEVAEALGSLEIGCLDVTDSIVRFVTHLSLSERAVKYAADVISAFGG